LLKWSGCCILHATAWPRQPCAVGSQSFASLWMHAECLVGRPCQLLLVSKAGGSQGKTVGTECAV
jgi:hypothetical protein